MRAFEAAARLGGFVAAAEELNVTPGAVSQHVKTLETWAGTNLFARHAQGVKLTPAGRSLLPGFMRAFDALGDAARAVRDVRPTPEVHIATLPSIAQLWLPARLARIREESPGMKLSVTALETPPNLSRELFDLALFLSRPINGPNRIVLQHDRIFPVCSPQVATRIEGGEPLDSFALLQDQTWQDDWTIWARSSGVVLSNPHAGPRYSLYSLALEEARTGAGILMGHECLVQDHLRAGTLVRAHGHVCLTGASLLLELPASPKARSGLEDVVRLLSR